MKKSAITTLALLTLGLWSRAQQRDTVAFSAAMDEVVVTAQYAPTDTRRAIYAVRTINRDEIVRRGAINLEQLLSQDVGVRIQQDQILGSSLSLLGVSGQNIRIMIDGAPVVGRLNGNIDLSQLNLYNIERVEIVEGPVSTAYGSDALGGVINLITRKQQRHDREWRIDGRAESRGAQRMGAEAGLRFGGDWLARLNGGRDWFDGFGGDGGRDLPWNPKRQWYFDGMLRKDFDNGQQARYHFSAFDEMVTNLGALRRPQFKPYAFDDYYHTRRMLHNMFHEGVVLRHWYLSNMLSLSRFDRVKNTYRSDLESQTRALLDGEQDTSAFHTLQWRVALAYEREQRPWSFQLGWDARQDVARGRRIVDTLSRSEGGLSRIEDYAFFGGARYRLLKSLHMETSLRWAYNTRYPAPLTPSFHLKYDPFPLWSLRASYAQGFRSPDAKELFFEFIDINHFIIGNADLRAERSHNVQAEWSYRSKKDRHALAFSLKGFYNRIFDKIDLFEFVEEDGRLLPAPPGANTFRFSYFNQEEFRTQGALLRMEATRGPVHASLGLALIGYFNPLSREIPSVDRFTYTWENSGALRYRFDKWGAECGLFLRMNDRFVSYYPERENGEERVRQRVQDGFSLLDASFNKRFWSGRIWLNGGVRNIFDVQRVGLIGGGGGVHSGGSDGLAVGVGRSFFLSLSLGSGVGGE
jgi:outer membrane receptor for ferrienterochelin and colicins